MTMQTHQAALAEFHAHLQAVDCNLLKPLVRQALNCPTATVLAWKQQPLEGGAAGPEAGILGRICFTGWAHVQDEIVPWSLVLKAFTRPTAYTNDDPTAWNYWKRELLAYQSGLLADLGGGLAAPRCFGVVEYPNEEYWLWMEYIHEAKKTWSLARYQVAARHLGQFNGRNLLQQPLPAYAWFSVGNLRQRIALGAVALQKRQCLHPPSHWLTAESLRRTLHLWTAAEHLYLVLDQLPHCLCHGDGFRRNLLARQTPQGKEQTVAIDWSAIGPGVIGEEVAILVAATLHFLDVPVMDAPEFAATVFAGYVAGLHDVGWQGDEALVRFAYTATIALFVTIALAGSALIDEESEGFWPWAEQLVSRPQAVIEADWRQVHAFGLDLGEEALALLNRFAP